MNRVRAARGATTVESNDYDQILNATKDLVRQIIEVNQFKKDHIISIIFTMTKDLNAVYPAVAARQLGLSDISLMCMEELEIEGSLNKCIRIMMHVNTEKENSHIKHIYLKDAVILRPDLTEKKSEVFGVGNINIAIDGPAGAGKSTISKLVSKNLDIIYLDTGAMYRAIAYKTLKEGISFDDAEKISEMLRNTTIAVEYKGNVQQIILDEKDVTTRLRTPEVTSGSSKIAVYEDVRNLLVHKQRNIATKYNIVMDGRDIGSNVLPRAKLKIFLTATFEERAKRRYQELNEKGEFLSYDDVIKDIENRDKKDTTRAISPLIKAEDAIVIDTTVLTIEQVVSQIVELTKNIKW